MKSRWRVAAVLLLSMSSAGWAADPAQRLLDESAAAYAALQSYRDTGTASVDDGDGTVFATAFARPDRLRFAWTKTFMLFRFGALLVSDGHGVTMTRDEFRGPPTVETMASLAMGVAGATGVSLGAANTIATLLLPHLWEGDPDPFGRTVLAIQAPRLVGDEDVETMPCRHVAGTTAKGTRVDVWIGTDDHLVRRVDTVLRNFVYREVHREIRVNQAIPDALFAPARAS